MEGFHVIALVGAVLALDHALVGQFMLSQPLVVGGIFGWLLGDATLGLTIGALAQLLWLGMIPVGAHIPSEHTVTGGVAAAMTVWLTKDAAWDPGGIAVLALAVSIPAGVLSRGLDIHTRRWANDRLARRAEAELQAGRHPSLGAIHVLALLPALLRLWLVYALWLGPVTLLIEKAVAHVPAVVLQGASAAYGFLPALGFAVVADMALRERYLVWSFGVFLVGTACLFVWPGAVWVWMAAVMAAAGAAVWWQGRRRTA